MTTLARIAASIGPLDQAAMASARTRLDSLTKPQGSLGRLETLAVQLAGITGRLSPLFESKVIYTLAADHGVAAEGVSAYPQAVTAQMVGNFLGGGAAINVLARRAGARVAVVDMGVASELKVNSNLLSRRVGPGTRNMAKEAAMSLEQAGWAVEAGMELPLDADLIGTGDMGIGNTTVSSAITAVITGRPAPEVTGRGTGITDQAWARKTSVVEEALRLHQPDPKNGLDVLSKVGGFEIGGIAGLILGAAGRRIPVILDGFISGAAALIAATLAPAVKGYLIAGHLSREPGHAACLSWLGLDPLLKLDLRLGEGTGAALAMPLVESASTILREMATFESAGVSGKAH